MKRYEWRHFTVEAYTKSEARVKLLKEWNSRTFNPLLHIPVGEEVQDVTQLCDSGSEPIVVSGNT
jgi:hypothetical protein